MRLVLERELKRGPQGAARTDPERRLSSVRSR